MGGSGYLGEGHCLLRVAFIECRTSLNLDLLRRAVQQMCSYGSHFLTGLLSSQVYRRTSHRKATAGKGPLARRQHFRVSMKNLDGLDTYSQGISGELCKGGLRALSVG